MPTRGYRKGISDDHEPLPRQLYTRVTAATFHVLHTEADQRSMTLSRLVRALLEAHVRRRRVELPHARTNAEALRELCRIGNNLNQLAHEAHLMRLHLLEAEVRECLGELMTIARRLSA